MALKQPTSWKWFKHQTGHSEEGLSLKRYFCPSKMKNSVFFPFTPHFLHFYLLLFGLILSKYSVFILCYNPLKREEKKNNPHMVLESTVSFKHKLGSRNSTWKKKYLDAFTTLNRGISGGRFSLWLCQRPLEASCHPLPQ